MSANLTFIKGTHPDLFKHTDKHTLKIDADSLAMMQDGSFQVGTNTSNIRELKKSQEGIEVIFPNGETITLISSSHNGLGAMFSNQNTQLENDIITALTALWKNQMQAHRVAS